MIYKNYLETLSKKFERRLDDISSEYNFELGHEFEVAICEILRDFLPIKYGITRGFIITKDGQKAGDDIIIYDQERFPTLKLHYRDNYSRKEGIPVEAVYAYIEAKHTLKGGLSSKENVLSTALSQICAVKKLCNERNKVPLEQYDPYIPFKVDKSVSDKFSSEYPNYRNPVFTMIMSCHTADITYPKKQRKRDTTIKEVIEKQLDEETKNKNKFLPDIIIGGNNIYSHAGIDTNGKDIQPTIFLMPDKDFKYFTIEAKGLCYGIALANLFAALDWIRLDKMPWIDLLNEGISRRTSE